LKDSLGLNVLKIKKGLLLCWVTFAQLTALRATITLCRKPC